MPQRLCRPARPIEQAAAALGRRRRGRRALHLQRPQRPQPLRRLRGRSGRGPGEGTRPAHRVRPVRFQEPRLGPATRRLRLRHERRRGDARPRQGAPLQPALLRLHAATGRPGRRDAIRLAGRRAKRLGGVVGTLEDTAAERLLDQDGHRQEGLRQSGRAVRRPGAGPARRRAARSADRRLLSPSRTRS